MNALAVHPSVVKDWNKVKTELPILSKLLIP